MISYMILALVVLAWVYVLRIYLYQKSEYYDQTKTSYIKVTHDMGKWGEYLTYKKLKKLKGYKRWLFNSYIPKDNGETTELDVVLLHESGIHVFESKNYSGWIFGTETQKYWTQVLPTGHGRSDKNRFFNPIMQNKGHIKWLQNYLGNQDIPIYSYIVFSERCTLKDITLTSNRHSVINRDDILSTVRKMVDQSGARISAEEIDKLNEKLYPLTQITGEQKSAHIENIKKNHPERFPTENDGSDRKSMDHVRGEIKNVEKVRAESVNQEEVNAEMNSEEKPHAETKSMEEKRCPRCGAKLVLRTASKGEHKGTVFWGCSRFPKCRYLENCTATDKEKKIPDDGMEELSSSGDEKKSDL